MSQPATDICHIADLLERSAEQLHAQTVALRHLERAIGRLATTLPAMTLEDTRAIQSIDMIGQTLSGLEAVLHLASQKTRAEQTVEIAELTRVVTLGSLAAHLAGRRADKPWVEPDHPADELWGA